jgi:hypothetical protein
VTRDTRITLDVCLLTVGAGLLMMIFAHGYCYLGFLTVLAGEAGFFVTKRWGS